MVGRKKAHINAFLLAMAITGCIMGFGLPVVTATPDDHHEYDVWIKDSWLDIEGVRVTLITDSYEDGNDLGTVQASQEWWRAWWAYTTYVHMLGTDVDTLDDHRKVAQGTFVIEVYITWPWPIDSAVANLHTEVSYYGNGFSYDDWCDWSEP